MHLSMWMLKRLFKDFIEESVIADGSAHIELIQLIESPVVLTNLTLSTGTNNLPTASSTTLQIFYNKIDVENYVLLKNLTDQILISSSHHWVCEKLFEYQQQLSVWEENLFKAKLSHLTAQTLIDICEEQIKSPMLLANLYGEIICISSRWPENSNVDVNWKQMWDSKRLPQQIMDRPIVSDDNVIIPNFSFEPQKANPICPGGAPVMGMYIGDHKTPLATLFIFEHDFILDEAEKQFMKICAEALTYAKEFTSPTGSTYSKSQYLTNILEKGNSDSHSLQLLTSGWREYDFWYVIVIHNLYRKDSLSLNTIIHSIGGLKEECIFTIYDDKIVGLLPTSLHDEFLECFKNQFNPAIFCIGISLPFPNLSSIPLRYRQAILTLDYCHREAGVYYCKDYSFYHLLSSINIENQALELSHPMLQVLKNYDMENGTELYETLFCYLMEERSTLACANKLFIHKNTMIYRIKKIESLIGDILNNADERQYMMLSYYLNNL